MTGYDVDCNGRIGGGSVRPPGLFYNTLLGVRTTVICRPRKVRVLLVACRTSLLSALGTGTQRKGPSCALLLWLMRRCCGIFRISGKVAAGCAAKSGILGSQN